MNENVLNVKVRYSFSCLHSETESLLIGALWFFIMFNDDSIICNSILTFATSQ